jgi:hypothetical protein
MTLRSTKDSDDNNLQKVYQNLAKVSGRLSTVKQEKKHPVSANSQQM